MIGLFRNADEAIKLAKDDEDCNNNENEKVFLITGGYGGIGAVTVQTLLKHNVAKKIIIGGRNRSLQDKFIETLIEEFGIDVVNERIDATHIIDLNDLQSVHDYAVYVLKQYEIIDVLICNAGIMNTPPGITKDGFEQQMGVNVIGHFLLCKILIKHTKRQIWVSSYAHTMKGSPRINIDAIKKFSMDDTTNYDGLLSYQQSKLGNILLSKEFIKRYKDIEAVSLHPGTIYTSLYRTTNIITAIKEGILMIPNVIINITQIIPKTTSIGASTTITCSLLPSNKLVNGGYYSNCTIAKESESAKNEQDAAALYDYCDEVTKQFQTV